MSNLRVGFGRYELGSEEGDMKFVSHMQKLEKEAPNNTDAFRALIQRDMEHDKNIDSKPKE